MNAEADREEFRRHVAEADRLARGPAPDADAANAETAALETLTEPWKAQGRLVELLSPLLEESEPIQFNAASILLGAGHADVAVPALEALRDRAAGPEGLSARLVLDYWRRREGSEA
jgi:hypothetical protein